MSIEAISGGDCSQYEMFGKAKSLNPENRLDKMFEKLMSKKDVNNDGFLDSSEFKIPDDKFAKIDSNGDSLIDQSELKEKLKQRIAMRQEKLKALLSGSEYMQAEISGEAKKTESSSETEETFEVEIPDNGIDDDKDGEIDEDDGLSLMYDTKKDDDSSSESNNNLFDILA